MILIINICKEKLHNLEFVKPIEDILKKENVVFFTKHYLELTKKDLIKADKVIICGISLNDNVFVNDIEKFKWVRDFEKPLLGICAGMQIIGLVYGGKLEKHLEIGYFHEEIREEFLGIKGEAEVYHLHNNYVNFSNEFEIFNNGKVVQAIKHKLKDVYGVLFHPEVRNKEIILEFAKL